MREDLGLNCDSPFTSYVTLEKLINFLVMWISPTNTMYARFCQALQTHGEQLKRKKVINLSLGKWL